MRRISLLPTYPYPIPLFLTALSSVVPAVLSGAHEIRSIRLRQSEV